MSHLLLSLTNESTKMLPILMYGGIYLPNLIYRKIVLNKRGKVFLQTTCRTFKVNIWFQTEQRSYWLNNMTVSHLKDSTFLVNELIWLHRAPFCCCSKLCTDLFCFPLRRPRSGDEGSRKEWTRGVRLCKLARSADHFPLHDTEFPPLHVPPQIETFFLPLQKEMTMQSKWDNRR